MIILELNDIIKPYKNHYNSRMCYGMEDKFLKEPVIEFLSFCIESFKVKYKKKGKEVASLFDESGVIDFLVDGYDILHTQGKDYIIEEIEIYLAKRGYNL